MKLIYFSWIREKIGRTEEEIDLSDSVITIRDLINDLKKRGEPYNQALEQTDVIRIAIDHQYASLDSKAANANEIAFFPPMTGG